MPAQTSKYPVNWNLALLYKEDNDPKIAEDMKLIEAKSYEFINKWKDRKDYLEDPKILKEAITEYENWVRYTGTEGNVGYYLFMRSSLDQNNPEIKARINKITDFAQKILNDIKFFDHRISKIDKSQQEKFLKAPELKEYHHFLKKLFEEAKYLLTEDEEKIMILKSKTSFSNWVEMLESFLSKEEALVANVEDKKSLKNFSEIAGLLDNSNKKVRDSAAKAFNKILEKWIDVAENEINTVLEDKKIDDSLRKVSRPDELRHIGDDIETEVVDALIDSVSKRFDIAKKYYELKAKLFKQKKLAYHERNLQYGTLDKKYSYEDSVELIKKVFKDLDPQFLEIFEKFINEGRIDVYPKKGKTNGAFCMSGQNPQPTYVLLNHNDKLQEVLTLAHEMGHAIHFELAKKQNSLNDGASTATAEVASTFMEDFVLQEILKEADDELKLSLMMMKLGDDVSTIIRQVACYKFEWELHHSFREKGYLSKEEIGKIFQKNMSAYMGDFVSQDKGSQNWWVYWSHIRRFFYVYSYASGLLISKAMQNEVKKDPAFVQKVKEFFASGTSDTTKNIFLKLGIDISDKEFWNKGLNEIEELLKETEVLAKKLGKI